VRHGLGSLLRRSRTAPARIADITLDPSGFGAQRPKLNSIFLAEGHVEVDDARGAKLGSWRVSGPFDDDPLDLD
jgi:hypothetical protein